MSGKLWEVQSVVFYVSGRSSEAQSIVFYGLDGFGRVICTCFTCLERLQEVPPLTKLRDRVGPLKKDLTRAGEESGEALGGSIYRILRVWEALGGPICRISRVWMGVWGAQILTALTYRVGPLEKDLTRAGEESERLWEAQSIVFQCPRVSGRLNL